MELSITKRLTSHILHAFTQALASEALSLTPLLYLRSSKQAWKCLKRHLAPFILFVILLSAASATGQQLICPVGTVHVIMIDSDRFLLDWPLQLDTYCSECAPPPLHTHTDKKCS